MGHIQIAVLVTVLVVASVYSDMMRKSIVFDEKNLKKFYCPQEKPKGPNKMIVKARPIEKLCEFEGGPIPKYYKSDCYNDVDESEYACAEKDRIMTRLNPPNETETTTVRTSTTGAYAKTKLKKQ